MRGLAVLAIVVFGCGGKPTEDEQVVSIELVRSGNTESIGGARQWNLDPRATSFRVRVAKTTSESPLELRVRSTTVDIRKNGWTSWIPGNAFALGSALDSRRIEEIETRTRASLLLSDIELTPGTATNGTLGWNDDVQWFTFPAGLYTVYVDTTSCGCADVALEIAWKNGKRETVTRVGTDINLFYILRAANAQNPARVGIRRLSGTGCFTLLVSPVEQTTTLRTEFSNARWSAAERGEAAQIITIANRDLMSATDGMHVIQGANFYPECPLCDSDVFLSSLLGRSFAIFGLSIKLFRGETVPYTVEKAGRVLTHELGHHLWWLPDEYEDPPGSTSSVSKCPPSLMGTSSSGEFCWSGNHAAKKASSISMWEDILQDWSPSTPYDGKRAPQGINFIGIENAINAMMSWSNCVECQTVTFPPTTQAGAGIDTDWDGVPECAEQDSDGDGQNDNDDCDPSDPTVFTGVDADGDGVKMVGCGGNDCDDLDADQYPGNAERCDGKDQDCDGKLDNGFPDTDADGTADCLDVNDDNDCLRDTADSCPLNANCSNAQAVIDKFGGQALTCVDPCAPLKCSPNRIQDMVHCLGGGHPVDHTCMIDGCSVDIFGQFASIEDLRGAGFPVFSGPTGGMNVFVMPGFDLGGGACATIRTCPERSPAYELECRKKQRELPSYTECAADSDGDGRGDVCD